MLRWVDTIPIAWTAVTASASLALKHAIIVASAGASAMVGMASMPISLLDLQSLIGERWIAVFFAVIANSIRLVREKPARADILGGYLLCGFFAFITAYSHFKPLDAFLEVPPSDLAMFNGAVIGTFYAVLYTIFANLALAVTKAIAERVAKGVS